MYWSRSSNLLEIAQYLALTSCIAIGGWLVVTHAFRLRKSERLLTGFATGLLIFIGTANLIANLLPVATALWAAALGVLLVGLLAGWQSKRRPWLNVQDLSAWPQLIFFLLLVILFVYIQRGLSLFDEYLHIPLTSIMAAGDIPPHFYLNPQVYFAYHYGIHILAASLVRLGTLFPWSALDLSKAVMIAFTLLLSWLWVRRLTRNNLAGFLGSFLIAFGGGARWLLVLLPTPLLEWISAGTRLVNTGADTASKLITALSSPWVIEGGGAVQFPFAFHNGLFVPVIFQLGSTGAMPHMTIILLLLLVPRRRFSSIGILVNSLIFATLALSAEHLFALLWVGIAMAAVISLHIRRRRNIPTPRNTIIQWGAVLTISATLSAIQGGFITESIRSVLLSSLNRQADSFNAYGFSLRWPPAYLSGHLGSLSLFNLRYLIVLLAVLGPALLMIPIVIASMNKKRAGLNWFWTGLGFSAVLSMIFPLLFQYGVDRSITRMPLTGMWTFLLMGFPLIWCQLKQAAFIPKLLAGFAYILVVTSGVVIFIIQLSAIPHPQYTYFIETVDTYTSKEYWNELPADTQVFDSVPHRAVTLFGNSSRAYDTIYEPMPEWEALVADPSPEGLANAGYDYIYIDRTYWQTLSTEQKMSFQHPCVDVMLEEHQLDGDYRILMNVSACGLQ